MAKLFNAKDFVRLVNDGRIAMVMEVESRLSLLDESPRIDLSRYRLQFADGSTLANAPGYLLAAATDEEAQAALDATPIVGAQVMAANTKLEQVRAEIEDLTQRLARLNGAMKEISEEIDRLLQRLSEAREHQK